MEAPDCGGPCCGGPWLWRPLVVEAPGCGGPWLWRSLACPVLNPALDVNWVRVQIYRMVRAGSRHVEAPGQPSVVELWRPTLP